MKTKKAFTLIELLVVVAIIGILASLLLPTLKKAREKSRRVVCVSQVAQNTKAFDMYLMDNDYVYPSMSKGQAYAGNRGVSNDLAAARPINSYLYGRDLADTDPALANLCPSGNGNGNKIYELLGNSYGLNREITLSLGHTGALSVNSIQDPSRMIFLIEWPAWHVLYKPGRLNNAWSLALHGEKGDYVSSYVDGHVTTSTNIVPDLYTTSDYTWRNGL